MIKRIRHLQQKEVHYLCSYDFLYVFHLGNEEALAIELIMVRYTYAFAFYAEANPLVCQLRDKLSTTFKSNSATVESYQ